MDATAAPHFVSCFNELTGLGALAFSACCEESELS
jgi:hypothetical protein